MTHGIALSEPEQQYIRTHINDGPGRIAFDLGWKFKELNGGKVSARTVRGFIYREKNAQTLTLKIPAKWLQAAREKGIVREDLISVAERAVLEFIRKKENPSLL